MLTKIKNHNKNKSKKKLKNNLYNYHFVRFVSVVRYKLNIIITTSTNDLYHNSSISDFDRFSIFKQY